MKTTLRTDITIEELCKGFVFNELDEKGFFKNLARISKKGFAVSTPNFFLSKNTHRFHLREFCPDELPILAVELGLIVEKAWCQLPGRGVFAVDTGGLTIHNETTHGFCILFKHP